MELKALIEKRNTLLADLKALCNKAVTETRAFTDDEKSQYDAKRKEVEELTCTIRSIEEQSKEEIATAEKEEKKEEKKDVEEAEARAFDALIRRDVPFETRADTNMTKTENGSILPKSIADKIIRRISDICPLFTLATRYDAKGTLAVPYYDETTQKITMAYSAEFNELESTSGKFSTIELTGFLAGVLAKISKSLINNSSFDIVSYVIEQVAYEAKRWIENELLNGTLNKIEGLSGVTQIVTSASTTAITSDELIDVQEAVPDAYQDGAIWIMNRETRKAIRKLKDGNDQYILNKDATMKWGYELFGKPVYTTGNMKGIEAGKTSVYYGDMTGLAIKVSEDVSVEVLREKYSTQHAVGVLAWLEMDAKIENQQKISALKIKTSA